MCLCSATSAAGLLGQAVGKELFCKQYCDIFVRKAAAGLQLGSASVTEYGAHALRMDVIAHTSHWLTQSHWLPPPFRNTFNFFASLAVILKDDFKPLIDRLMVPLMDAMRMDDGAFRSVVNDDSGGMDKHIDMVLGGDDEEEEEEEDAGAQLASGTTFGVSGGAGGGAGAAEDSEGSDEDEYGADELYVGKYGSGVGSAPVRPRVMTPARLVLFDWQALLSPCRSRLASCASRRRQQLPLRPSQNILVQT